MSLLSELWLRIKFKVAEIGMTAMGGLLGGYSVASFTNEPHFARSILVGCAIGTVSALALYWVPRQLVSSGAMRTHPLTPRVFWFWLLGGTALFVALYLAYDRLWQSNDLGDWDLWGLNAIVLLEAGVFAHITSLAFAGFADYMLERLSKRPR